MIFGWGLILKREEKDVSNRVSLKGDYSQCSVFNDEWLVDFSQFPISGC